MIDTFGSSGYNGPIVPEVRLEPAFCWTCPACKQANYGQSVQVGLEEEEKEALYRIEHDLEDWESLPDNFDDLIYFSPPTKVVCVACRNAFPVCDEMEEP